MITGESGLYENADGGHDLTAGGGWVVLVALVVCAGADDGQYRRV